MTSRTRKLTSLLLSLVMVFTMIPAAFAITTSCPGGCHNSVTWLPDTLVKEDHYCYCNFCRKEFYEPHTFNASGVCTVCNYQSSSHIPSADYCSVCYAGLEDNAWTSSLLDPDNHYQTCVNGHTNRRGHVFNSAGQCIVCGEKKESTGSVHNVSVTISEKLGVYYFTDGDTLNGYSIYDQIVYALSIENSIFSNEYEISLENTYNSVGSLEGYSRFFNCRLNDLDDVYLVIEDDGTWSAQYSVTLNGVVVLSGTIFIVVEPSAGQDILYSAAMGESVVLDANEFYNFWHTSTDSYGTLNSIRITSIQGLSGTLCYNHSVGEKNHNSVIGTTLYATPTGSQKGFNNLTFIPSKSGNKYNSGTVTIHFTASGNYRYTSTATTSVSGKVVICYTNGQVTPIVYTSTSSYVTLNSVDFDNVYKTATGISTRNPSYTVKFLNLPTYGTLYRNYSSANFGNLLNNELTNANISNLVFSNRSGSSNYIGNVTYVPSNLSKLSDSIQYAVYSGSTLVYIGTIQFNTQEIVITYNCSSAGVTFSSSEFFTANTSLLYSQYISFGTPTSGTLYKNYSNGKGTIVGPYDYFSYSASQGIANLNTVTYVPTPGFSGTVEIPFFSSNLTGVSLPGKIRIYVAADVFSDVNPNEWYAPYINRLYAAGVIGGTGNNTFSPKANMKYGEALKMILLAAGHPKQLETGGTHWASNYLTLAYSKGIVSSTNIDLNAPVNRDTIAEIAAKALGLKAASGVNAGIIAPSDSTNGFVYALYNAGIVNGQFADGRNYYLGSEYIIRAEIAKIICNIMDYQK